MVDQTKGLNNLVVEDRDNNMSHFSDRQFREGLESNV